MAEKVEIYGYPATVAVTLRDEHGGVLVIENPVRHIGGGHVELDLAEISEQVGQAQQRGFGSTLKRTPTTPGADLMYPCRICGVKGVLVGEVCYDDARVCKAVVCDNPADPASPGGLCPACAATLYREHGYV